MDANAQQNQGQAQNIQPQQQAGQQEDYLDKGLDAIEKQFGKRTGHNIDSNKMRSTNEKITDGARGMFEKLTGKHVPEKFSN